MKLKNGVCLVLTLAAAVLAAAGCGRRPEKYEKTIYSAFDTVSTFSAYAKDQAEFNRLAGMFEQALTDYHRLFDIYNDYSDTANIKTINDNAGKAPVHVDQKIIDLLKFGKTVYELTDGKVNIAFGSVLSVWHDYRSAGMDKPEAAALPPMDVLSSVAEHTDISKIVIDETNRTVYLEDAAMRLDVGAIAKGYAAEQICSLLMENGLESGLLDLGGNIRAVGKKADKSLWQLGLQNPEPDSEENYVHIIGLEAVSLVTSGNYQRYYVVDGKRYHHIINPDTLMPSNTFSSVSVICKDSGMGDALSTALFNMSLDEGMALIEGLNDTEALWILSDGTEALSSGFKAYIVR